MTVTINYPNDPEIKQYKIGTNGDWINYSEAVIMTTNDTIFARSQDLAGNWSAETNLVINNIDKVAPETPSITTDTSSATNGDVKVTIIYPGDAHVKEYRIDEGTWIAYSGPITVSENTKVEARATDAAGNDSDIASIEIDNIDKTKPEITLTPSRLDPVNTEIDVDVEVIDNNPIIEKKWAKGNQNEGFFATGGTDISGESFIVSENGVYTVYAKDSAGNISIKTIDITNIDMEAPVITLTPSKINPTNTEITVDVEASDNVKVIERKWVAGDQPVSYFVTGGTVLTGNSFIVSQNGIYTVYVKDSAGNETVQTINISNIDMEAPVITLTPSRIDAINTEIDVDVDVNDHNAIVIQKWAKGNVDLSFFQANGTEITNGKFIVGENGVYTVYAKDSAGNESLQTITISNIDKEAPVITLTPSKIDPVNTEIDVDIEVVDHNPIVEKKWAKGSVDERYFATNGTDITGDSFLVSENGVYTVYAKDSAGNISLKTINITNIDMEAPVITLTPSKIDPTNTEIDVDVDAADNVKVIERKWAVGDQAVSFFEKDGTVLTGNSFIVSKNGTYTVYAKDSAGNETVQTINITNIDVEAPVITLTPSKIDAVNIEIDVDVDVTDHNAIISQKWAKGDQVLSYFQSNGSAIINGKFIVSENGIYTVYAKDSAGNESIQTITISNIDMDAPVITLTPSKIDPVNTEIDVDVTVVDNNPIDTKKWAAGNKDSAYFQTGGKEVVNDKFIVSENGIYTVYAKDSAGNETLQTIEINNIDVDVPDVALLKASTTDPTNKAVTVTITYPDDVTVKEYKIGSGTWTTYEGPITISNNDTVYARGKDAAGNWSEVTSLIISNIDKTAPVISFSGITNGQTYVNQVTPLVSVEDLNKFTTSILLNGEAYDGSPVTESGSYVLTVKAVDEAGNESIQTIAFHVNHSPEVVGSITDKKWKKFEEETIDLSTIFKDKEDTLTYSVTSSDEKSVSALVKDGTLHIKALKQGTATISIIAHDGFSDSEMITFKVEVNSAAPTISIINDQTWITADGEKFTLEGLVTDKDKEEVTITATINGVEKSVTILTTGEEDTWSIEFDGTDLAVGIHTVSIQAKDQFDGSAEIASSKYIVKVPVTLKDYEPIISTYESDIVKDRQDFSETEHKVLLDAFIAVESLKTTNNPDAWLTVKPKVDLLAEGTVKTEFYKAISGNALDYLIDNLDTATKTDYETAGLTNVQENLVPTYNEKNVDYLAEKGELTGKDIQLIIDIVNAVDKATTSNQVEDWNAAKTEIEKLADGVLKNEYLQVVEDGFIKAIEMNPDELTVDLIGKELGITANQEHQVDYQMYLQDELAVDPILTKERLEGIIQTVDKLYDLIDSFMEQPTQENLTAFENAVEALTDGNYQSKNEGFLPGLNLEMVVNDPKAMTEDALNTIGITHDVSHIPLYQDFLTDYLVDVSKGDITKEILQQIIHVVDAIEKVKENPTDENIQDLLDLIGGLNPDASVIDKILDDVGGSILDKINDDFSNVTEKQLENIGIDNVDGTRMPEYQDALNEYAKEKDPTDLTHEDIQNIIDAVNGVENAKANPSEDTIRNGYDAVNKLDDGPLKDKLLQELEDIAVDYIAKNPDKITQELLDYANLDTDPELIDSYKDYLQDVLPGLSEEITKEKLQELIDQVNEVWAAYHEAMTNPSKKNVLAFETLANALVDGVFKTKMVGLVDDVALAYLKASPSTQEADDYARMGVTIVEENLSSYNTNMEKYIKDLGTEKFSLTEVQQVITVTNKVETALADSKTANVQQALSEIRNLENGKLKTDLNSALNGQVIGDINLNPSTVTADDLINLGIENVNPDYEKLYQDALTKLKDDLGGTLTFEDVQNAVDSVNAVEKALETGNNQDILDAFEEIKQLPDGSLKDYLTEKLQEEVVKEIIENPENITTEHLENGGFIKVDPSLEEEYKDALTGYEQPLTKEAVQQIIDVVNQVKKTRLDLTQNDVNTLSNMVDRLAESETKENLVKVKNALRALLDAEQYMNVDNLRKAFDKIALVETRENAYLKQMATSLSQVRSALVDPSDETVGMAQAELIKLDSGQLKDRMQSRIGGAYLEHVITNPGSSQHSDWINAGFENVIEDNLPLYKDAVNSITNEVGQLTKEQIQAIINAINAIKKAKENPTNQTIQNARDAINKVVESQQKKNWLAEMDALWQSIQPKPKPTPNPIPDQVKPPVVKQEPLPLPSDRVMVVSNEYASVVMTIPKIEVSETDSLKVKIKVSAKDILEGSKLYLYANSNSLRGVSGTAVASTNSKYLNRVGQQGHVLEIDFGKLEKGTIEVDRDLVFDENGEYLIKGVFVANGANLETNTVKVSVYKDLLIPNTVLPNQHGLPVATLKANQDIALYKKDENGNFVRVSGAKAGTLHQVYDTEKGFYKLADGYYIQPSAAVTVHIGKGEIRKDEVNVYDKNGRFIRTIKKGQQYKVYSYDNKRYAIGGGEYIEVQDGVTYVFGWITVKEPMTLYKPDGTAERTLKAGEKYRVYRADKDNLHLGGGYTVKRVNSKYDFIKN
ncbi:hypothetical protein [Cytobacillus praedii]|uniref:hypothetical protein n=1 Tax=Cytobacillus praedii TaxID=1742358 RepID=UPI002E1A85B9|nr:hypothetical protein [Cytobacillus praedii]